MKKPKLNDEFILIGKFKNEHDEEFEVYRLKHMSKQYLVRGDETAWEMYIFSPQVELMFKDFKLTEDELRSIKDIIKKNK